MFQIKRYAIMQQIAATGKSPKRNQATTIPANKAIIPDHGVGVANIISGKVITAKVTYGT